MNKILGIIILCLLLSSKAFAESEKCKSLPKYSNLWYYNKCDEEKSLKSKKVKTWKNRQIPEEYHNPNLETLRYHFLSYNKRGERHKKFYTKPSSQPTALKFNLQKEPKIIKKIV